MDPAWSADDLIAPIYIIIIINRHLATIPPTTFLLIRSYAEDTPGQNSESFHRNLRDKMTEVNDTFERSLEPIEFVHALLEEREKLTVDVERIQSDAKASGERVPGNREATSMRELEKIGGVAASKYRLRRCIFGGMLIQVTGQVFELQKNVQQIRIRMDRLESEYLAKVLLGKEGDTVFAEAAGVNHFLALAALVSVLREKLQVLKAYRSLEDLMPQYEKDDPLYRRT